MINKIHIFGASGSGVTTLGEALSSKLNINFFDTDNYYWQPTIPQFQVKREVDERIKLLSGDLNGHDRWILTGSLCGWGDVFIPEFDLAVFIYIPPELRIKRLMERERKRYSDKIEKGGSMYTSHKEFIDWASKYDTGDVNIRSKILHEKWIENLECKVIRLEGDKTVDQRVNAILKKIVYIKNTGE